MDVVLLRPQDVQLGDLGPRVRAIDLSKRESSRRRFGLPSSLPLAWRAIRWLRRRSGSYDVVFGVDRVGLILAWLALRRSRVKIGSLLVEFYLPPKWSGFWNRLGNWLEGMAYRRCDLPLVQDRRRAEFLAQLYGLDAGKIRLLPNSPLGLASGERTSFVHERLGVPQGRTVVVQAGVLDRGTRFDEVVEAARGFPPEWAMVFQSSRPLEPEVAALVRLEDRGRIFLNPEPLPYGEVEPLVRSAHVGVALYRVLSPNTLVKGAAAGKVAMYLKCGVPVVLQDLPSFLPFVEKYRCGVAINDPRELRSAIETILADYDAYRAGAMACFNAEFAADPHLDSLAAAIRA